MLIRTFLLATAVLASTNALAVCKDQNPNWLWNYQGTIDDKYLVRMTLVLGGQLVTGRYFYVSQLRDIQIKGTIIDEREIVLDELDAEGNVTARFEGKFEDRDPKGSFNGSQLACEVIDGFWQQKGSTKRLPVYLRMESGTPGKLGGRYASIDADEKDIHEKAFKFWSAVKRGDRKTVATMIEYPVQVNVPGGRSELRSAKELLANYDDIFTPRFRESIANAVPKNMFFRDQGIMLGNGEVWFRPNGKVFSLNN